MGDLVRLVDYKKKKRDREALRVLIDVADKELEEAYFKLFEADTKEDAEPKAIASKPMQLEGDIDYGTNSYTQLILSEQERREIVDTALAHFDTLYPPNSGE